MLGMTSVGRQKPLSKPVAPVCHLIIGLAGQNWKSATSARQSNRIEFALLLSVL